jgi:hypothetical protein
MLLSGLYEHLARILLHPLRLSVKARLSSMRYVGIMGNCSVYVAVRTSTFSVPHDVFQHTRSLGMMLASIVQGRTDFL